MGIGTSTARIRLVRKLRSGTLMGAGVLTLAGCGSAGAPDIAVELSEFAFGPRQIELQAGQKNTLVLKNVGTVEHSLSIPQLRIESPKVASGQTVRFDVVVPPGSQKILCSIPGHEEAGMVGEIRSVRRR